MLGLTVLFYNLSPGPLWSTSWYATLYFVLHTFLHPIIIFLSQHMHISSQPVLLHTHTHLFNGPLSWTTRVSRYQKCKTNLDFTEARDSEWQWQQLGHMQVCTSLQTDNHASTPPLSFLQAGCPSCHPTNSIKALKPTTCFAKVPKLWHLFIISLSTHHLVICLLP